MKYLKHIFGLSLFGICCWFSCLTVAFAAASLGDISSSAVETISNLSSVLIAMTYAIGAGFGFATIIKYKAHRDNPQQVPISMVITLLIAGLAFLGLGLIMSTVGSSIFGPTF